MTDDLVGLGKAAGRLIESGEKFIGRLFGPWMDEKGRQFAETSKRKYDNLRRIAGLASELVGDRTVHPVPGRTLFPLLSAAGNEDDESMQAAWARLLATAATDPNRVPPSYPRILADLSPAAAKLLDHLCTSTDHGPGSKRNSFDSLIPRFGANTNEAAVAVLQLERHGLVTLMYGNNETIVWTDVHTAHIDIIATPLGEAFHAACTCTAEN